MHAEFLKMTTWKSNKESTNTKLICLIEMDSKNGKMELAQDCTQWWVASKL